MENSAAAVSRADGADKRLLFADSECFTFGRLQVDRDLVKLYVGFFLFVICLLVWLLRPAVPVVTGRAPKPVSLQYLDVETGSELVEQLQSFGLWDIEPESVVPPVVLNAYPDNFDQLGIGKRKKVFLHSLLPVALVAMAEVRNERQTLLTILQKIGSDSFDLDFEELTPDQARLLSSKEEYFVQAICRKYRTSDATELLNRINVLPKSLLLAQGAIESSWGGSRFVREGNNLFGIWTWGALGIVPTEREEGKQHKVAQYKSILDSVRAYLLIINRVPAYRYLREMRKQTMDPLALADGLLYYSERREDYVWEIKQVIRDNELQNYDSCILDRTRRPASPGVAGMLTSQM